MGSMFMMMTVALVMMPMLISMSLRLVVPPNEKHQAGGVVTQNIEELSVKVKPILWFVVGAITVTGVGMRMVVVMMMILILLSVLSFPASRRRSKETPGAAPRTRPRTSLFRLNELHISSVDCELRELLERGEEEVAAAVDATKICRLLVEGTAHSHLDEGVLQLDRRPVSEHGQFQVRLQGLE